VGVRIEVLRGDRQAAIERLDEAAKVAQTLSLNRLRAMVENQRSAWDFLRFLNSMRSR
jgi:serine/threonine-protein kinase PknK